MNIIQLETKESKKNIKTHSYKETELDEWFRQNCVFRTDHTIENTALYNDYVEYCKERATPSVALREFTKEIPPVVPPKNLTAFQAVFNGKQHLATHHSFLLSIEHP